MSSLARVAPARLALPSSKAARLGRRRAEVARMREAPTLARVARVDKAARLARRGPP